MYCSLLGLGLLSMLNQNMQEPIHRNWLVRLEDTNRIIHMSDEIDYNKQQWKL